MRSIFLKSLVSAFALFAVAAFVAAGAMAQDAPKVSGGVYAGFGQAKWESGGTASKSDSALNGQIEANLIVSGAKENVDYYFRLRARGTTGDTTTKGLSEGTADCNGNAAAGFENANSDFSALNTSINCGKMQTIRVRVGWNGPGGFRLEGGRLPSIGGVGYADIQPVRAPSGFRHFNDTAAFYDVTAIVASFKTGGIKVGLGLSANCDINCKYDQSSGTGNGLGVVDASAGSAVILTNQNSSIVFFQGAFGDVKVGARVVGAGSKVKDPGTSTTMAADDTLKASANVVEAAYTMGGMMFALEFNSETDKAPNAGTGKDWKITGPALAVSFLNGNAAVQYSSQKTDKGATFVPEQTWVSAFYLADVGGGKVGGEFVSTSYKSGATTTQKGTLIRLLLKSDF